MKNLIIEKEKQVIKKSRMYLPSGGKLLNIALTLGIIGGVGYYLYKNTNMLEFLKSSESTTDSTTEQRLPNPEKPLPTKLDYVFPVPNTNKSKWKLQFDRNIEGFNVIIEIIEPTSLNPGAKQAIIHTVEKNVLIIDFTEYKKIQKEPKITIGIRIQRGNVYNPELTGVTTLTIIPN